MMNMEIKVIKAMLTMTRVNDKDHYKHKDKPKDNREYIN
jgi:hypothetical protein